MRPFLVDDEIRSKMKALALHAEKNPFSMDDLLDIYNGAKEMPGDRDEFTVHIPFGYRVVFSFENQVKGDVRHMSMSVDADNKLPSVQAVKECMKMLGYKNELEKCIVKIHDWGPNRQVVHVWEVVS